MPATAINMRVWHHFFGISNGLACDSIIQTLAQTGISTYPLDLSAPRGMGIIFFDEITPRFYDFLREVSHNGVERVLAIATGSSLTGDGRAWSLLHAGASDVFAWNHSRDQATEIAVRLARWESVDSLVRSPLVQNNAVGQSPAWTSVLRRVVEMARFTDAPILITGESGTGKELIARLIHTLDQRPRKRDLIVLDCTTVVPELSGSEFFGHERGAFTGAISARDGAFAVADGGTLFLDEVGELSLRLQAELLRVVQERTYKPVGSNTWKKTNFRLVCATNKELDQEVTQGDFRRDFYFRIAACICKLPSLRERSTDIIPLVRYFLMQMRPDQEPAEFDEAVRSYLLKRDYPGNVRDLKQLVARISYRHVGPGPITIGCIPEEDRLPNGTETIDWRDGIFEQTISQALSLGIGLKEIGRAAEDTAVRLAIDDESGNLPRAARRLGISDRALQMRQATRRTQSAGKTSS